MKKILITLLILSVGVGAYALTPKAKASKFRNPFTKKDYKSKEIKYAYEVKKEDLQYKRDQKLLNRHPSGYMTVEEYEKRSEYKDPSTFKVDPPKIEKPSDFKYVPQPLFKIVKYNDPPGGVELQLGRKLYFNRYINGLGVTSPDYTKLVYPAIYYYSDSGSVGADLFVIPLDQKENNMNKILKANTSHREESPILSTDKAIDNYAAFRTLTPVDFNADGTKLLAKEKIGSGEDGIWETRIYIYDFKTKKSYDLSAVRDAIKYYWKEYENLNLIEKRWDIRPLGFDAGYPDRVVVQAYGYTGEKPIFLGTWSVDCYGEQPKFVSLDKNFMPKISMNGFKLQKDGALEYQVVVREEKVLEKQGKIINKQVKAVDKKEVKKIKQDYKFELKELTADYKDKARDNNRLQKFAGSTEGTELEEMYHKYQVEQTEKDIKKLEKKIEKTQKNIDKREQKIQKYTDKTKELMHALEEDEKQTNNANESSQIQMPAENDTDAPEVNFPQDAQ